MKQFIIPSYTFTPGASGVGTVNLSGISGFNIKYLAAVINQTRGVVIYSTADPLRGYTNLVGTTLTLNVNTSTHSAGDTLQVMYELTDLNPLTNAQLRASDVPITGTVTANTGLSQPLTDAQLRATAVPVSGTFFQATQPVSIAASVAVTGPLTDAQLRATPVPVSGTVTANTGLTQPLTDAQLRASAVPVSGTFFQATQPVSAASLPLPSGAATSANQTTGNSSLSSIDAKLSSLGQKTMASSAPVVIASDQSAIPITGSITASNPSVSATGAAVPAQGTMVGGTDGTNLRALKTDANGELQIDVLSSALPSGAATSANQITVNNSLSNIDGKLPGLIASRIPVDGSGVTQPISVSVLPLPSGASTETTLSSLNTKVPSGLTVSTSRLLVDGSGVTQPISAASLPLATGAATSSNQTTTNTLLTTISGKLGSLGQSTMAGSAPVVIASNQSAIPITGSITATNPSVSTAGAALPTDATLIGGSDAVNLVPISVDSSGVVNTNVLATVLPTGAATETTLASIDSKFAALTNTVPDSQVQAPPVRQVGQDVWNASFSDVGTVISPQFTSVTLVGMTFSQGSGSLAIVTGTGARNEFLVRSQKSWRGSLRMRGSCILSQRIVNQNFNFILADLFGSNLSITVNSATNITVTKTNHGLTASNIGQFMFIGGISGVAGVQGRYAIASIVDANNINFTVSGWPASGSGTATLFGHSHVKILFSGTTATNAAFTTQRNGWADVDTTATINTTASPGTILSLELQSRECYLFDQLRASTTTPNVACRASRLENIPDENIDLYLWIWAYNGTTAPASTTTWTISFVSVEKFANQPVYLQGLRANGAVNPIAVAVQGTVTTSFTQPALVAGTAAIGDVGIQYRANVTGTASASHLVSSASTNATIVKGSAGRLLGWSLANTNAAWRYVKFHNQTTNPTPGSGVVRVAAVPPNGVSNVTLEGGIAFSTGIGITTVTGANDADLNAVGTNDLVGEIFFA